MVFRSCFSSLIAFVLLVHANPAPAQSGRGRPRVPTPQPTAPPPPPVKVPEAAALAAKQQSGSASRFVLKNGIAVVIDEQYSTAVAAIVIRFGFGYLSSSNGVPAGSAHLIEHLVAKAAAARLDRIGGIIKSDSSALSTEYIVLIAPERVKEAVATLAEVFQAPAFTDDEIRREAAFVNQEFSCNQGILLPHLADWNDPGVETRERLLRASLSPGRASTVATDALPGVTREQIVQAYNALYRPETTVITIVGGVNAFETLVEIQRRYTDFGARTQVTIPASVTSRTSGSQPRLTTGAATAATPPAVQTTPAPASTSEQSSRLSYGNSRGDLTRSVITIGYRTENLSLRNWLALDVLTAAAARGRASQVNRALLASRLGGCQPESSLLRVGRIGVALFQTSIPSQSIDQVESLIFKETERLRKDPIQPVDLVRAKALAEKRLVESTSTYERRARWLAAVEAGWATLVRPSDYRDGLMSVSVEDLQSAAKNLSIENLFVYEREPLSAPARTFDADSFAATVKAWAPGLALPGSSKDGAAAPESRKAKTGDDGMAAESLQPLPVKDFSTLSGPRAFVREDHSQPQVTVGLFFQGGRIKEDDASSGITELMLRSMLEGTSHRQGGQIANDLDQLGSEVEVISEPDFFGLLLSVLSRNGEPALKIVREILEEPAFRDEDIDHARSEQLREIAAARDSAMVRARELLFRSLFAGHPYSLPPHGREEVIKKTTGDQLKSWYAASVKRQYPLVVVVGDTDGSALISAEVAERFRRNETDKSLAAKIPREPSAQLETVEQRQQSRTVVASGVPGPRADNLSSSVLPVLRFGLDDSQPGGQRSQLVNDAFMTGGAIYEMITVPANGESAARDALRGELERLGTTSLSPEALSGIRAKALVGFNATMQSQRAVLFEYARAVYGGRQASVVDDLPSNISTVTADDVKKLASGFFRASAFRTGVVRSAQPGRQN